MLYSSFEVVVCIYNANSRALKRILLGFHACRYESGWNVTGVEMYVVVMHVASVIFYERREARRTSLKKPCFPSHALKAPCVVCFAIRNFRSLLVGTAFLSAGFLFVQETEFRLP